MPTVPSACCTVPALSRSSPHITVSLAPHLAAQLQMPSGPGRHPQSPNPPVPGPPEGAQQMTSPAPRSCETTPLARTERRSGALALPRLSLPSARPRRRGTQAGLAGQLNHRVTANGNRKVPCQTHGDEPARLVTAVVAEKALGKTFIIKAGGRAQCPGPSPKGAPAGYPEKPTAALPSMATQGYPGVGILELLTAPDMLGPCSWACPSFTQDPAPKFLEPSTPSQAHQCTLFLSLS